VVECKGGVAGVVVGLTDDEFFGAYSSVFRMSDGSAIQRGTDGGGGLGSSTSYFYTLMSAVGADVVEPPSGGWGSGAGGVRIRVCGGDVARIALLAVVGNFVSPAGGAGSSGGAPGGVGLPTVVVDARTGRLDLVGSLSAMRAYFLEAMLVVSILAIARLSMVQTVSVSLDCAGDKKET
jgi:hypothetical protein